MLRIICRLDDNSEVAGFGGNQQTSYRTYDIEAPEVEEFLRRDRMHLYESSERCSVIGVEVVNAD